MSHRDLPEIPSMNIESGLSVEDNSLLNARLPHDLKSQDAAEVWAGYQAVIGQLLIRMGTEHRMLDSIARAALVGTRDGVNIRIALIPILGHSARHALVKHGVRELPYRLAGECTLMELSAAAGYRTFCLPDLVRGLLKTGKMKDHSVQRMLDTFEFLNTMCQHPIDDPRVAQQLRRTNGLHRRNKVAGAADKAACDLFKYIGLNMFYIGPSMRPDLTPQERHALCGLTVLVAKRMGHTIEGSVKELEAFVVDYEASHMFNCDDPGDLRKSAIEIAQASKAGLEKIPTISRARVHGYVPHRVKKILELE